MQLDFYHGGTAFGFATTFWGATSAKGSITSRCSGYKPTLTPEQRSWGGTKTGLERAAAIEPTSVLSCRPFRELSFVFVDFRPTFDIPKGEKSV